MAIAYIRFGGAMGGGAPVLAPTPSATETLNTTSTSTATAITARGGDYARITAFGGRVRIAVGSAPVALAGAGDILLDGGILDIGPLKEGDKIAAIDAA